jgi:hypothetical protein
MTPIEEDRAAVRAVYPDAYDVVTFSTGGMKLEGHTICNPSDQHRPVGPTSDSEEKAWRYAADRVVGNFQ